MNKNRTQKEEDLIKELVYPEEWPDYPDSFSIIEKTPFSDGTFEIILSSDTADVRVSTHEDVISGTVKINEDFIDYQFEVAENFYEWLEDMYVLPQFRLVVIQQNMIKGFKDGKYLKRTYTDRFTEISNPMLTDCNLSIQSEPIFGPLQLILHSYDSHNYLYIYDEFVIEVSTRGPSIHQYVFPIPSLYVVYNSIEAGELDGYSSVYINDDLDKKWLAIVSL